MSKDTFRRTDSADAIARKTERTDALGAGQPEAYDLLVRAKEEWSGIFAAEEIFPVFVTQLDKVEELKAKAEELKTQGDPNAFPFRLRIWREVEKILLLSAFASQDGVEHNEPYPNPKATLEEAKKKAFDSFFDALGEEGAKRFKATDFSDKPYGDFSDDPVGEKKNRESNERNHNTITENILRILMTLPLEEAKEFYDEIEETVNNGRWNYKDRGDRLVTLVQRKLPEVFPIFSALQDKHDLRQAVQMGKDVPLAFIEPQVAAFSARLFQTVEEDRLRKAHEEEEAGRNEKPVEEKALSPTPLIEALSSENHHRLRKSMRVEAPVVEEQEQSEAQSSELEEGYTGIVQEAPEAGAEVENKEEAEELLHSLKEQQRGSNEQEVDLDYLLSGRNMYPNVAKQDVQPQEPGEAPIQLSVSKGKFSKVEATEVRHQDVGKSFQYPEAEPEKTQHTKTEEPRGVKRKISLANSFKNLFKKNKVEEEKPAASSELSQDEETRSHKSGGILKKISSKLASFRKKGGEGPLEEKHAEPDTTSSYSEDDYPRLEPPQEAEEKSHRWRNLARSLKDRVSSRNGPD